MVSHRAALHSIILIALCTILVSSAAAATPKKAPAARKGVVEGRILTRDGGSMAGGQILFYNAANGPAPQPEKYDRTPEILRDLDAEGRFRAEIPAGRYYIGAAKKASGEPIGPPVEGDFVWRSLDKKGNPRVYTVKPGRTIDIGTVAEAIPLRAAVAEDREIATSIEGVVADMDGAPVADAVVVAFLDPSLKGKPVFVSEKTGKEGRYVLRVSEGTYFLRARNMFSSGPPEPGQIIGYYGEGTPSAIAIRKGERKQGVDFRVILFPGRGPFSGTPPSPR